MKLSDTFTHGYALLIGVGESRYSPWSLPVTVKDTQAIYATLIDTELCAYSSDGEHIRVLNNQGATKKAILEELEWLKEKSAIKHSDHRYCSAIALAAKYPFRLEYHRGYGQKY